MRQGSTWDARCRSGDSCFHERLRGRKDRSRDRQLHSQVLGSVVRRNPNGAGCNQGLRPPTRTPGLLVQRNLHPTPLPNAGVSDGQSDPIHTPVHGCNRLRPHPKSFEAAIGGRETPEVTETCSACASWFSRRQANGLIASINLQPWRSATPLRELEAAAVEDGSIFMREPLRCRAASTPP